MRETAVRWLRVHGGPRAMDALIGALDDQDGSVRVRAAMALGEMKVLAAVTILTERAQSDQCPAERRYYIEALGEIGDLGAVPALVAALDDPDARLAESACGALAELRDPSVTPALIAALNHPDAAVVRGACSALSEELGDGRAVEPLLGVLGDQRWSVRHAACRALLDLKATNAKLDEALERLIREPEGERYRRGLRGMKRLLAELRGVANDEASAAEEREEEQRARARTISTPLSCC